MLQNTINTRAAKLAVTIMIAIAMIATGLTVSAEQVYADTTDFSGEGENFSWTVKSNGVAYDSASVNENLTVKAVGKVNGKVVVEQGGKMKAAKKKGTLVVKLSKKHSGYITWSKIKKDKNFKKALKKFKKKYKTTPKTYRIKLKSGQKFWNSGTANGFKWLSDYAGSKMTPNSKAWIRITNSGKTAKKESCTNTVKLTGKAPKSYLKYGSYTLVLRGTAKAGYTYSVTIVKTVKSEVHGTVHAYCKHDWTDERHAEASAGFYAYAYGTASLTVKVNAFSEAKAKATATGTLTGKQKAKLYADAKAEAEINIAEKLDSQASGYAEASVNCNTQKPKPVVNPTKVNLQLKKNLTGKTLESGEFSFELSGNGYSKVVSNDASGNINFNNIPLTAAGTYTFTVKEVNAGKPGYTYDNSVKTATVVVVPDGETALKVQSVTWSGGNNTFNNSYSNPDQPPVVSIVAGAAHVYEDGAIYVYIEASDPDGDNVTLKMSDISLSGVSGHLSGLTERNVRWDGSALPAGTKAWRVMLWSDGGVGNITVSATVRSTGASQVEKTASDSLTIPVRPDDF